MNTEDPGSGTRSLEGDGGVRGFEGVVDSLGRHTVPTSPHFRSLSGELTVVDGPLEGTNVGRVLKSPELSLTLGEVVGDGSVVLIDDGGCYTLLVNAIIEGSAGANITDQGNSDGSVIALLYFTREVNTDLVLHVAEGHRRSNFARGVIVEEAIFLAILGPVGKLRSIRITENVGTQRAQCVHDSKSCEHGSMIERNTYAIGIRDNANVHRKAILDCERSGIVNVEWAKGGIISFVVRNKTSTVENYNAVSNAANMLDTYDLPRVKEPQRKRKG